jgi:HK97 family phage prohead protease
MARKLFDQVEFHRLAERGEARGAGGVIRASLGQPKILDEVNRGVRFCFSDDSIDRMGDRVMASGWDLVAFAQNPVALFGHDSSAPPIGRARDVRVEGDRLMGTIQFAPPEMSQFADEIYRMVKANYLRAVSVGFLPLEWKWSDDDTRRGGIDFRRQELVEISVVPVPANSNALVAASAKGLRKFSPRRSPAPAVTAARAPEPALSTLSFFGTHEARTRQLREATAPARRQRREAQIAVARLRCDTSTREGARAFTAVLRAIYREED